MTEGNRYGLHILNSKRIETKHHSELGTYEREWPQEHGQKNKAVLTVMSFMQIQDLHKAFRSKDNQH